MVIFERLIAGIVRYRKVFLPSSEQLADLVSNLRTLEVLRVFSSPTVVSNSIRPITASVIPTALVDLSKGQEATFARMNATCRNYIRRADKLRERIEIMVNTDAGRRDFLPFYNKFARNKSEVPLLKRRRFCEFLPHADVFMLYFDGQLTCGRLVLRDEETRTAQLLYSATTRLERNADTTTVSFLNRYLHWHEMKFYQAAGMDKYDFGGAREVNPSVTQFKMSFGGQLHTYHYCVYAGSGRAACGVVHALLTKGTSYASNTIKTQ
jgi:hypothetical protein